MRGLQEKRRTCDVASCKALKNKECFDKTLFENARKYDRALVCLECQAKGFSPKDVKPHNCGLCGEHGHLKFDQKLFGNHKARSDKLLCKDCVAKESRLKQVFQRSMAKPNAWKCTCPGKGMDRTHLISNEKCGLHPQRAGEKRWPGKNVGVREEDFNFLEQARKYRKKNISV